LQVLLNKDDFKIEKMLNSEIDFLIKKNLHDFYVFIANLLPPEYNIQINDDYSFIKSVHSCWPDFIYDVNLKNNFEISIAQINEQIESNIAPPLMIIASSGITEDAEKIIEKNGFKLSMQWPGMAMLTENFEPACKQGNIEIIKISHSEDLNAWFEIVNYELFPFNKFKSNIFKRMLNGNQTMFFLGKADGVPVATLMTFISSGIAGIYMVAVNEKYRKKGVGSEITREALAEVKKMDCRYCCLQSTIFAKNMYSGIGFKEYSDFNIYWKVGKL
jgi:ribosomal protein S18 acetylase RimI-like enzyme